MYVYAKANINMYSATLTLFFETQSLTEPRIQ